MSDTIWVAIITACSAIIPQIIITIIKNNQELKIKELEIYEQSKREALNNFIQAATECSLELTEPKKSQLNNFYKSVFTILAYFPEANDILSELDLEYICSNRDHPEINQLSKSTTRELIIKLTKLLSEK